MDDVTSEGTLLPIGYIPNSKLCRIGVAATQLGLSKQTVERFLRIKQIPIYRLCGTRFISWDDVVGNMDVSTDGD